MMKIAIDGSYRTGNYRCECECGTNWHGQGEPIGTVNFSPALPIAETVVHMKLTHHGTLLDIRWSDRFAEWLLRYWERASLRMVASGHAPPYGITPDTKPITLSHADREPPV
jgi:hypothetical protein